MAPSAITTTEEYQFSLNDLPSFNNYPVGSFSDHGACKSKQLIGEALKSRVEAVDADTCGLGDEDAFFVADLGEVYRQHLRWKKNLARVKPHYGEFPRAYLKNAPLTLNSGQVQPGPASSAPHDRIGARLRLRLQE